MTILVNDCFSDSMNISAALSISTNTIGGQASGSYIDSDKFKESDMNYFVQVKVSNQKKVDPRLSKLHLVAPVKIPPASPNGDSGQDPKNAPEQLILAKFREIYGVRALCLHLGRLQLLTHYRTASSRDGKKGVSSMR